MAGRGRLRCVLLATDYRDGRRVCGGPEKKSRLATNSRLDDGDRLFASFDGPQQRTEGILLGDPGAVENGSSMGTGRVSVATRLRLATVVVGR